MKKLEGRVSIITLAVKDLTKATDFYQNIFGWQLTDDSNENIKFLKCKGQLLSLYPREKLAEDAEVSHEGHGFKGFTLAYNTYTKDEVDSIFEMLKSKGVTVVKEPNEVFWGGYSGYISDPDGNLWEIAYNPFMKLSELGEVL